MSEFEELVKEQMEQQAASSKKGQRQSSSGTTSAGDIDKVLGNVFGKPAASSSSTMNAEQVDEALQPVAIPAPKPKAKKKSSPVKTDKAPTVDQVLDPERPDLNGASHELVLESIERLVNDIYTNVLDKRLTLLQASLAKTAPPEPTPFALKLLGWVVETVASWTVASIGKIAAKELLGHKPAIEEPKAPMTVIDGAGFGFGAGRTTDSPKGEDPAGPTASEASVADASASIGAAAGGALKSEITKPRPTTEPAPKDVPLRAAPGETLLVEFITRQHDTLHAKKNNAIKMLSLIRASAGGKAKQDFIDLDSKLQNLIESPDLSYWFQQKVTMEWLNFVARVSMGPRATGQTTDMIGANTIDGIASGGPKARQQWVSGAGFVEITLTTPDVINGTRGLAMQSARIPSSFGAMLKLKEGGAMLDANGHPYNLATLPVYRRVWLQTGSSKFTVTPAFVITPDGQIEADVGNPVLAAVGARQPVDVGESTYMVGGDRFTDEQRKDPDAWSRRAVNSSQCTAGAHLIREMLRRETPGSLQ